MQNKLDEGHKEGNKYRLTKFNTVLLAISLVGHALIFFTTSNRTPQFIQQVCASFIAITLIPYFVGWITWHATGKRTRNGSWSYSTVFALLAICSGLFFQRQINLKQLTDTIVNAKSDYAYAYRSTDSAEEFNKALLDYSDTVADGFKGVEENSIGNEKKFYEILNKVIEKKLTLGKAWVKAFEKTQEPRMLQYARLKDSEEIKHQKEVVLDYQYLTREWNNTMLGYTATLESELGDLLNESNFARDFFDDICKREDEIKEPFKVVLSAHIDYGNCLMELLQLLESHSDHWRFENDTLIFENQFIELSDTCIQRLRKSSVHLDKRIDEHNNAMLRE